MGASGSNDTFTSQLIYFWGMRGSGYLVRDRHEGVPKGGMMRKFNRIVAAMLAMLMLALTVVIAPAVVRAKGAPHDVHTVPGNVYTVPGDVYTVPGNVYGVPGSKTIVIIMIIGSNRLEGKKDAGPQIKWGRTFVPLASIIEALGGRIDWNAKTHTVTIVLGTQTLVLHIGNAYAVANGKRFRIGSNPDVAPYIQAPGRTMLPVRFIAEKLGAFVIWNSALHSVTLVFVKP